MCGGTTDRRFVDRFGIGLSPRVRGNPLWDVREVKERRSIPACAGEPPSNLERWYSSEVYPRVCGGTLRDPQRMLTVGGLSPRVRGNHVELLAINCPLGSIPACAGEP